ncbi:uncharacterized protein TRAVEDRAFT_54723 [Trametes versicolor FP-101664 SS1]|uniref:Uncharacterized protein n=1 Tax=Trametes versicolor (strain FP-101664) TaxID=717944 RepID=R7S6R7_TRAVS|nr:uncharacterized protein TRAVEDRAFT_54723 [Trametes versicolor FP-101664 SS1]EIW51257.1 hypothetical protein TRAVEDRAFT_54723 [Trametes versicolor FP-101664 SS1]
MFVVSDVMGKNEHAVYRGETVDLANSIAKLVHVEEFVAQTVSLHVLSESSRYTRKNIAVVRSLEGNKYSILPGSSDRVCKAKNCKDMGLYRPDTHILRWCQFCRSWFHVDCLKAVLAKGPTVPKADPHRPDQYYTADAIATSFAAGLIQYDHYNWTIWLNLLKLPIQRGQPGCDYPLSYELLLVAIRATNSATGCPADVRNFVLAHLSPATGLAHQTSKLAARLYAFSSVPSKYYRCPNCTTAVII